MKKIWNGWIIAFAMYSKIPMPAADWTKENMSYALCFFPWVGAVTGVAFWLWNLLASALQFGEIFRAAGCVMIPLLITGGIHLDGFLDTSDAMSSWQERERRLEILKDSHTGAFAVICAGGWFLTSFAVMTQMSNRILPFVCMTFLISRSLSALSIILLPKANPKGTVAAFSRDASQKTVRNLMVIYLILLAAAEIWIDPLMGSLAFVSALGVFFYYRHLAMKYFGGTTGDLAGYFLTVCETVVPLVLVLAEGIIRSING